MKIALLVNRENFEAYAPPVPGDWDIVYMGNGKPDTAAVIATEADVLIVDAIMKIGSKIIEAMPGLKLIHSQGVGFAGIDLEAADKAGVYVCNNAGANAKSVAEHTLLLALALIKRFNRYENMVYAGRQMEAKNRMLSKRAARAFFLQNRHRRHGGDRPCLRRAFRGVRMRGLLLQPYREAGLRLYVLAA